MENVIDIWSHFTPTVEAPKAELSNTDILFTSELESLLGWEITKVKLGIQSKVNRKMLLDYIARNLK